MSAENPADELILLEQDDPGQRGEAQGELWRAEIHELAALRLGLTLGKSEIKDEGELLEVARRHIPILDAYHPELAAEFAGIARGAAIDPALLVVLNHYTDLRDIPRAALGPGYEQRAGEAAEPDDGGCTAVYIPGAKTPTLGQTWDMHRTASPYVRLLRVRPKSGDSEQLFFTLVGCLAMTGINQHGVAITINNLTSTDAQIGVLWPALVRAMLSEPTAAAARDRLLATTLSSGHHYMVADGRDFYGIESSGQRKILTQVGAQAAHIHTNHCFDPALRQLERVSPVSTTFRRMDLASTLYAQAKPQTPAQLWDFLCSHEGYPKSICAHAPPDNPDPHASETCGRIVMDLHSGEVMASRGCGHTSPAVTYSLDRWRGGGASPAS